MSIVDYNLRLPVNIIRKINIIGLRISTLFVDVLNLKTDTGSKYLQGGPGSRNKNDRRIQ